VGGEYSVVEAASEPFTSGLNDETFAQREHQEEVASKNVQKEEAPILTKLSPVTGDLMVRLPNGEWGSDDGSVEFAESHLQALKSEANLDYLEASVNGGVEDSAYMASLESK